MKKILFAIAYFLCSCLSLAQADELYLQGYNVVPFEKVIELGIIETRIWSETISDGKSYGENRSTIHQYKDGRIVKELAFMGVGESDSIADFVIDYFYFPDGRPRSASWRWMGLVPSTYFYQYNYASSGKLKSCVSFFPEDGSQRETKKISYTLFGRIKKLSTSVEKTKYKKQEGKINGYNAAKNLVSTFENGRCIFAYSSFLEAYSYYYYDGNLLSAIAVKDSAGNMIRRTEYAYADGLLKTVTTKEFLFDEVTKDRYVYYRLGSNGEPEEIIEE